MLGQSTNHPPLFYSGPERRKTPRTLSSAQQNATGTVVDNAVRSIAERRGCGGSLDASTFSPDGLSKDVRPRIPGKVIDQYRTSRSKNALASDPGYEYIGRSSQPRELKHKAEAAQLSLQILNPKLNDPSYLVLRERRRILTEWIKGCLNKNCESSMSAAACSRIAHFSKAERKSISGWTPCSRECSM